MTKEEIINSMFSSNIDNSGESGIVYVNKEPKCFKVLCLCPRENAEAILDVFNQTAEKDKRIKELTEALSRLVFLHNCEQEGLSSGQPTPEMWFEAVEKASEVLNKK